VSTQIVNLAHSLVQFILMIITLTIGVKYFKHLKELNHFVIIPLIGIIQYSFTSIAKSYLDDKTYQEGSDLIIKIYVVIEFIVFVFFFIRQTPNSIVKNILTSFSIIFLTYFIVNVIQENNYLNKYYYLFTSIEAFIIISFSLNLYIHLIFDDTIKNFNNSPPFLITTSLFFFFTYTFPFYFFDFFLTEKLPTFFVLNKTINGMAYIIFYLLLIKSLRCKIKLSK